MTSIRHDITTEIIAEFAQAFQTSRTQWARYAETIHPELRGMALFVLHSIVRDGPLTATELAHRLRTDKAVISRQVSQLKSLDMIKASPSPEDGRVILLTSSAEGRALIDKLKANQAQEHRDRLRDWSAEDLRQLQTLLHRYNAQR